MSADDPPPPSPRYEAEPRRTIGQGAFGRVLLVYDAVLGREVALKELRPVAGAADATGVVSASPELAERFVREARLTARLEHPGIVPVHDLGRRADGGLYYTMKVVRGQTLADAIAAAPTRADRLELLDAFVDVCQAVAYAHSRGIVHRDLKPQNVMVGAFGETVLLDWGVARDRAAPEPLVAAEGDALATRVGTIVGTPAYMSPEQARGDVDVIDERSDVWGLGAILYELVTGRRPYEGRDADAVLRAVLAGPPAPPPGDRVLASILRRAMAPSPADRYPDALDLARDVRAWRAGEPVAAHAYSRWERIERQLARHGRRLGVAALVGVGLAGVGIATSTKLAAEAERARRAEEAARAEADNAANRLADVLVTHAQSAVEAGSAVEALVYGAEALTIREDPRARGAVIAGDSAPLHDLTVSVALNGPAVQVAWGPAGIYVLERGRIERFDPEGRALGALTGGPIDGYTLAVAPDGRRVAATEVGGVRIWDPAVSLTDAIAVLPSPVRPLALAWVDDQRVAYADDRGSVSVWNLSRGRAEARWTGQGAPIRALAVRPDGRGIVSASNNHDIAQWDAATGRATTPLEDDGVGAWSLAISPDSRYVVAGGEVRGGDGRLRLWDLASGRLDKRVDAHVGELTHVALSPDGRWLLSAANEGTARLWRFPALQPAATLRLASERIQWGAFSPDSTRVALAGAGEMLRIWTIEPRQDGAGPPRWYARPPGDVAWSPSGRRLAVGGEDRQLYIYGDDEERVIPDPVGTLIENVAWRDEDTVYVGGYGVPGRLTDVRTGRVIEAIVNGNGHAVSPDRRWLHTYDERLGIAMITSLAGEPTRAVDCAPVGITGAWWPDGHGLLLVERDGGVADVPAAGGRCTHVLDAEADNLAIAPDGSAVAVASHGRVAVYDRAWKRMWEGDGPRVAAALLYSPDGRRLIAGDWAGEVSVWTALGAPLARWRAHRNRVWAASISPDGNRLATVSADRSARVWLLGALDEDRTSVRARAQQTTGLEVADGLLRATTAGRPVRLDTR